MSVKLIMGPSGSGKTYVMNKSIIEAAGKNPDRGYIVIVPEQFTMEAQKSLIRMSSVPVLMNVDVISFNRFAFRVFEELGINMLTVLDDTGKSLVLRKTVEDVRDSLSVFGDKIGRRGFIDSIKSSISELLQYAVDDKKIEKIIKKAEKRPILAAKLRDINIIYKKFREFDYKYITKEEVLKVLSREIYRFEPVKNSDIFFDGFTGFTPIQYMLIEQMAAMSGNLTFTITVPSVEAHGMGQFGYNDIKEHDMFKLSKETVNSLCDIAVKVRTNIEKNVISGDEGVYRLKNAKMLSYLERTLSSGKEPYAGEYDGGIMILSCADKRTEAFYVVSDIADTVRKKGMRYRDFAIVTADAAYYEYLREAFEIYDVPYFMDSRRSIIINPFVMAIRGALDIIIKNYSYESVMSYLRTYMTDLSVNETDLFDNYIFAFGIKGAKAYREVWTLADAGVSEDDLEKLNDMRARFIGPLDRLARAFSEKKNTVSGMTRALYDFIIYFDMEKKLTEYFHMFEECGESGLCLEYRQIYKNVMDLFDRLVNIAGDSSVPVREYRDMLEAGFNEIKIKIIPPAADGVMVGDIKRTRLSDVKHLFFMGVNDGVIPSPDTASNLLSGRDREFLRENGVELSPTAKENIFLQQFYLYLYLTKPSEHLTLSYSCRAENGAVLMPSYLIGEITGIFRELKEKNIGEDDIIIVTKKSGISYMAKNMRKIREKGMFGNDIQKSGFSKLYGCLMRDGDYRGVIEKLVDAAFYKNISEKLGRAVAGEIYGDGFITGVTRLEKYAACSFAHFMEYGLSLLPRKEYKITMPDIGSIYHGIIEEYFKNAAAGGFRIREIDDDASDAILNDAVDTVCEKYEKTGIFMTARNAYMISRIRRVAKRTVKILIKHIKEGSFEPKYHEFAFGAGNGIEAMNYTLSDGRLMKLTGKIDRADIMEKADGSEIIKIIDYKSGKKSFSPEEVRAGLQLQMPVYMDSFIELEKREGKKAIPGAILYFKIDDPIVETEDITDRGESGESGEQGYSEVSDEKLEEIVEKTYKMSGLVNTDDGIAEALDNNMSKTSGIIGIKRLKDGSYAAEAGSAAVSRTEFENIMSFVREKIQSMGNEIAEGNNDINPYRMKDTVACTYCEYKDICSFDARYDSKMYREVSDEDGKS